MTLQLDWLRGCATALVTPFANDGVVDEQRLRDLIEYQIAGGVRVLVPCGTTGESVTMTDDENQLVIRTTVELSRGRAKVIAGIPLLILVLTLIQTRRRWRADRCSLLQQANTGRPLCAFPRDCGSSRWFAGCDLQRAGTYFIKHLRGNHSAARPRRCPSRSASPRPSRSP